MKLSSISPEQPVLIAGPTASGKSALALDIAEKQGGIIINADASQVYDCWRVITARPSAEEEARAPHLLYGHLPYDAPYSAGHWLREVKPLLAGPQRPVIVGGTGLYFKALTEGMADIPATPDAVRREADALTLDTLLEGLDAETAARIDRNNRARVKQGKDSGLPLVRFDQGEPLPSSGSFIVLVDGQRAPLLPLDRCHAIVMDTEKDWLEARIRRRFRLMMDSGALEEARAMQDRYDPALPSCKAIGVPELMDHLAGRCSREEACERAAVATRQYAKRQRTWFRSGMRNWTKHTPASG